MEKKEVAKKIIESHVNAVFAAENVCFYDKVEKLPSAKENAYIIVDAQIKILKEGTELYLIKGTEGTDKEYWDGVKEEISKFEY